MNNTAQHHFFEQTMKVAIAEAKKGHPSPNPHVGAVIVKEGQIISKGFHEKAGQAHAEVMAIQDAGQNAKGSTLFVTFEPCNHTGRTGPCTEAIIAAGIKKVVIGCCDPLPHVPGAIARLTSAGIDVQVGVLEEECEALVQDFVKHFSKKLPWVTLKAALTLDGRIATRTGDSKWITNELARKHAHQLRAEHDAILVGVGTVLADDPALTVRHVQGRDPIRVILDSTLRTPHEAQVIQHTSQSPTWIFHGPHVDEKRRTFLNQKKVELVECAVDSKTGTLDVQYILQTLAQRDVVRLLVEGGAKINGAILKNGHVDEAAFFLSNQFFGDSEATPLAFGPSIDRVQDAWQIERPSWQDLGEQRMVRGTLKRNG